MQISREKVASSTKQIVSRRGNFDEVPPKNNERLDESQEIVRTRISVCSIRSTATTNESSSTAIDPGRALCAQSASPRVIIFRLRTKRRILSVSPAEGRARWLPSRSFQVGVSRMSRAGESGVRSALSTSFLPPVSPPFPPAFALPDDDVPDTRDRFYTRRGRRLSAFRTSLGFFVRSTNEKEKKKPRGRRANRVDRKSGIVVVIVARIAEGFILENIFPDKKQR